MKIGEIGMMVMEAREQTCEMEEEMERRRRTVLVSKAHESD